MRAWGWCVLIAEVNVACGSAGTGVQAAGGRAEPGAGAQGGDADPPDVLASDLADDEGPSSADSATEGASRWASDRFVTGVVSFDPGACAGFGAASMPDVVEGPPVGGGATQGSTDVVSLGGGGTIVVSFAPNAIVDGPGPDFIVFENPFFIGGNPNNIYAEPGEVSVSDDGVTWLTFPCAPTTDASSPTGVGPPYGSCAGWHPVYSNPNNGISPLDPSVAGGDAFDLADLGIVHVRYVRIVDKTAESCPDGGERPTTNGFDLDAVSIVNAELP
jgi:hypothetical protein